MLNIKKDRNMNTIKNHGRHWALLIMLSVLLPLKGLAQTKQFEMVVEKTDGTELAFLITGNYPVLQYMYGGENGVNTLDIQTADGFKSIPCPDVKRLYTREAQGSSGISKLSADGKSSEVYDIQGRRISSGATSLDGLPKGVYIVDGRKVIK